MGKLTSKGRAGLRSSQFALPGKRAYPVEDRGHAEEAIHVAGIQHAKGKLSAAQEQVIDAKAEHVLHAADGGFVDKPKGLRRDASNLSKNFARKSQANLRPLKMADGGSVQPISPVFNRAQYIEQQTGGGSPSPQPAPAPAPAQPVQQASMSPEEIALRQKYGMAVPGQQAPSLIDRIKSALHFADGGAVSQEEIAKQAGFPMTPPNPAPINPTIVRPPANPPWNQRTEPTHAVTVGVRGANGGHVSLRHAMRAGSTGAVRGPGGPTDDKVPAMLSNGEYVLPAKTVAHVGKDNLDGLVRNTNGKEPGVQAQHFAVGGEVGPDGIPILNDPAPEGLRGGMRVPPPNVAAEPSIPYTTTGEPTTTGAPRSYSTLGETGAAAEAAPAAKGLRAAGLGYRAGRAAGTVARYARPLVSGPLIAAEVAREGFGTNHLNDEGVDSSAMGTLRAAGNQIKSAFQGTALPSDREASQASLRKGAVETALDIGSGVAKTGDTVAGLVGAKPDLNGRFDRMVRGELGNQLQPAGAGVGAAPSADESAGLDKSGIVAAPPEAHNGTVSSIDMSPRSSHLGALMGQPGVSEALQAAAARGDFSAVGDFYRKNGDTFQGKSAQDAQEDDLIHGLRQSGRLHTLAGYLSKRDEIQANRARAMAQLRYEQSNKDRDYNARQRELYGSGGPGSGGGSEGRAEDEANQKSDTHVREQIASMIEPTTDATGKTVPDTARAAQLATSLNSMISDRVKQTKAFLAQHPNDPHAAAASDWLNRYEGKTSRTLKDEDLHDLVSGMEADRIAQQYSSGWDPYEGKAVISNLPITSLTKEKHFFRPDMYRTNRGDTIRASAIDRPGSTLGYGGQVNQNFDWMKKGLRQ